MVATVVPTAAVQIGEIGCEELCPGRQPRHARAHGQATTKGLCGRLTLEPFRSAYSCNVGPSNVEYNTVWDARWTAFAADKKSPGVLPPSRTCLCIA